jgi:hypothetical protein
MRSIIQICIDFDKPLAMSKTANAFLDYIHSRPNSINHRQLVMGLYHKIMTLSNPLSNYSLFFHSKD